MGIFSDRYLEDGYYQEDEAGNLTRINDDTEFFQALEDGNLLKSDGYSVTPVNDGINMKRKRYDDKSRNEL
jgi:hypothetical protein